MLLFYANCEHVVVKFQSHVVAIIILSTRDG
jgi:hypothetical protein